MSGPPGPSAVPRYSFLPAIPHLSARYPRPPPTTTHSPLQLRVQRVLLAVSLHYHHHHTTTCTSLASKYSTYPDMCHAPLDAESWPSPLPPILRSTKKTLLIDRSRDIRHGSSLAWHVSTRLSQP